MKTRTRRSKRYILCVSNKGYAASLVVRRLYEQVRDAEAERRGLVRVVDESGEGFFFPDTLFAALELTTAVGQRLATELLDEPAGPPDHTAYLRTRRARSTRALRVALG
jgi:hypothetical protein